MVRAAQGMDDYESGKSKFLKMTLGLKHYALYTVEEPRPSFIPVVTARDLWENYLPQCVAPLPLMSNSLITSPTCE